MEAPPVAVCPAKQVRPSLETVALKRMMVGKPGFFLWLLVVTTEVTSGRHVVKRADDTDPLEAVVGTHSQDLARMEARLQALEHSAAMRYAFRAEVSKPVAVNAPILFGLDYAVGPGYDPHTGVYTVPVSGVYIFHFQLFPTDLASYVIDLLVNGSIRSRSRCYDSSAYSTSCSSSSILHVQQGDTVWVQNDHHTAFYTGAHSYFSGALLSADP